MFSSLNWLSYEEGLKLSIEKGKPLFLFFTTPSCPYCKLMKEGPLKDPNIVKLIEENFIPVEVNPNKEQDLALKYRVIAVPCIIIITPEGKIIKRAFGYMSSNELRDFILDTLKLSKSSSSKASKSYITMGIVVMALLAGIYSMFSPCILPFIPLYLSLILKVRSRRTLIAALAGLALSISLISITTFTLGYFISSTNTLLQIVSHVIIIILGLILLIPKLKAYWSSFFSLFMPIKRFSYKGGVISWFLTGFTLGTLWIPCAGPLLGALLVEVAIVEDIGIRIIYTLLYVTGFTSTLILLILTFRAGIEPSKTIKIAKKLEVIAGGFLVIYGLYMLIVQLI